MPLVILLIVLLGFALDNPAQQRFDYLKVRGNVVESTHQLKYSARIEKSFKLLGEYHHQPTYGGKMFNVSVVAFARDDSLVMIHAEAHADNSGGLDYSDLKPDPLDGINFTSREQCAVLAEIPDADSIPDLRFLRDQGFTPAPAIFLKQFLTTSPDGSAEYVLSYGRRVPSCGSDIITPEFKEGIGRDLRSAVKISR